MILYVKEIDLKKKCCKKKNYDMLLQCDHCYSEFHKILGEARSSNYKDKNFHFCSLSCTRLSMRKGKLKSAILKATQANALPTFEQECDVCGISKTIKQYDLSPAGFFFCSKKCVYDAQHREGVTYELRKQKCINSYGVQFSMSREEIKEKRKHNVFEKYGVESVFQLEFVREKMKQTCQEKYGVDFFSQTEEWKEKAEETCIKRFGFKAAILNSEVAERRKQTMIERWGHPTTWESPILKNKIKETMILKYGYEIIALVPSFISSSMDKKMMKSCGKTWEEYKADLPEYTSYYHSVRQITNQQNVKDLPNYDKWGEYHLDHKFSIAEGYRQKIDVAVIGNLVNLEFIPAKENMSKSDNCSITKDALLSEYNKLTKEKENDK